MSQSYSPYGAVAHWRPGEHRAKGQSMIGSSRSKTNAEGDAVEDGDRPGGTPDSDSSRGGGLSLTKLVPLALIVAGLVAFFAFGLHHYLTFDQLKQHRSALDGWVRANGVIAPLLFSLAYIVIVAFSLPVASLATLVVGFLFGIVLGSIVVVIGATIGAVILFLAARYALGDFFRGKAGPAIKKMEKGFQDDAFSYLLVLRLVPLFPFFLVNLVPAFLGVRTRVFALATFIGIIPGSIVYVSVGNGLGAVFDKGREPDLGIIFEPEILLPIIGLAILALVPVIYKRVSRKRRT